MGIRQCSLSLIRLDLEQVIEHLQSRLLQIEHIQVRIEDARHFSVGDRGLVSRSRTNVSGKAAWLARFVLAARPASRGRGAAADGGKSLAPHRMEPAGAHGRLWTLEGVLSSHSH